MQIELYLPKFNLVTWRDRGWRYFNDKYQDSKVTVNPVGSVYIRKCSFRHIQLYQPLREDEFLLMLVVARCK